MTRRSARFGAVFAAGLLAGAPLAAAPVIRPILVPEPVALRMGAGEVMLGSTVALVAAPGADPSAVALVRSSLAAAGVGTVVEASRPPVRPAYPVIVIGPADAPAVRAALAAAGGAADDQPEGYAIASSAAAGLVVLAGHDADGQFHAAQSLRQILRRGAIPALALSDHPAMPIRGTIEGFYGAPWSMADRLAHLDFLARFKANTYVYSPKDDPYARARWREPYPAATLNALGTLAAAARRDHVDFVYAISPGPTACFSDPADRQALERKFDALRAIGIRSFYVALDDIEYKTWNCAADATTFGASGAEAAGVAQARFLNAVQNDLSARDPAARPLIMVPTEYYDAKESPYKAALRRTLDPRIVVQWTGTDVVPPAISVGDARAATKAFGRKTLLWDNYPVNDYAQTTGRLLLAPYARREAGLSEELSGILSNPMNQEAPSRAAVAGVVAFAWNDRGYDPARAQAAAARDLAGNDARATAALLAFFDTQHLAPTFSSQPWQEQAPALRAVLDRARETIAGEDEAARAAAIADVARAAQTLEDAPDIVRAGTVDPGFAAQAAPWLDALHLWGRALRLSAAGLDAARADSAAAPRYFAEAARIAAQAAAVRSLPGATRFEGPVKIADGVLDRFVADAPTLIVATQAPTVPPARVGATADDRR